MSRVFLSHSSANNGEARALKHWAEKYGWGDLFLDIDRADGLKVGQKWQDELDAAVERSEFVIVLISPDWLNSKRWCWWEFWHARKLGKRIFPVIVAPTPTNEIPSEITTEFQIEDLTSGDLDAEFPFSSEGLARLRIGLLHAGLEPTYFEWPPKKDPTRAPFPGLAALDTLDAAVFFGRDAPLRASMEDLHRLRDGSGARLFAIIGASGAGKSSFLRAGLVPRLEREPRYFVPLKVIRPLQAVLSGEDGLAASIEATFREKHLAITTEEIEQAKEGEAASLKDLLTRLADASVISSATSGAQQKPAIVLPIDQCEELFNANEKNESQKFLQLLAELLKSDSQPVVIAVITIRANAYETLQESELRSVNRKSFDLGFMPKGQYSEIIKRPLARLKKAGQVLSIDDDLVERLLEDLEKGSAKDALPLLAFILERLYRNKGSERRLTIVQYENLGGLDGSIDEALKSVLVVKSGRRFPIIRGSSLETLKTTLIPALVRLDPQTRQPVKVVAEYDSIDPGGRPFIDALIKPRLILEDRSRDSKKKTVEFAHEAIIRHWKLLETWLKEENAKLTLLNAVRRDADAWAAEGRRSSRIPIPLPQPPQIRRNGMRHESQPGVGP